MPAFPPKTTYAAGDILTAAEMNDVGNALAAYQFTVGKNKIINGDFGIWQRGTSFDAAISAYSADRWANFRTVETLLVAQQTFTAGVAPVAGYEGQFFARCIVTTGGANAGALAQFLQRIEDVRTFAGQTVTISFWAKADAAKSVSLELQQNFGTGGSVVVNTLISKIALTTSWARYSATFAVPSVSGKTIGANSCADFRFWLSAGSNFDARTSSLGQQSIVFDVWGVQLEAGSTATPFQTATGTLAGELQAAQRYFYQINGNDGGGTQVALTTATYTGTTALKGFFPFPVKMRTAPSVTSSNSPGYFAISGGGGGNADTVGSIQYVGTTGCSINFTASASSTVGYSALVLTNNASAYVALNAEL